MAVCQPSESEAWAESRGEEARSGEGGEEGEGAWGTGSGLKEAETGEGRDFGGYRRVEERSL